MDQLITGERDSQKAENLLNLALNTPEEIREKSLNLNVGYEEQTKSWELIVKYNMDLERLTAIGIIVEPLLAGYAILTVPDELVETVINDPHIEYVEKPKRLFFSVQTAREASCIPPVTNREPFLTGAGVIVAVIDSGIDYRAQTFRRADGSTRILYLWDQTNVPNRSEDINPPEGFNIGVEYDSEQINEALFSENRQESLRLLPSIDNSGHGTAVTGIAAGRIFGSGNSTSWEGVAVESDLLIVKLGVPGENSFPSTTELMRAITYVVKKAQSLQQPVAINLSFGNTYGAHDGTSLLERFLDNASEVGRCVICVGSGNEGAAGGHYQGSLYTVTDVRETNVELAVAQYELSLSVQLWKNYVDTFEVILRSPGGEEQLINTQRAPGKQTFRMENTNVLVYIGEPTPYSVTQEIYMEFIPVNTYVTPGIWTFFINGIDTAKGQYFFYLPSNAVISSETRFVKPSPRVTLTIPSTAQKVITVGAYDSIYESYADFSGRGYVYPDRNLELVAASSIKPDLAAPGVAILVPTILHGDGASVNYSPLIQDEIIYEAYTGTSFAVPFVTGAAALLMEWGIVRGNDPYLYGEKVKAYLRKGARPLRSEEIYPNERVGWGALCVADSLPI